MDIFSTLSVITLTAPVLVESCGYVPSSCNGDLSWAVSSGKNSNPEFYPNFQSVTGTPLSSATNDDMVLYWYCTSANPNGNCDGLQAPCSRSCYPSSSGSGSGSSGQSLSVITMNLFWWNLFGQRGGDNFFSVFSGSGPYDLLFFQECDDVDRIANGLPYDLSTWGPAHSVAVAWSNSRFTLIARGWENVAEDRYDQYYGDRCVVWARLQDTVSGLIVFAVSHHGPLPVDTGGATGGAAVASRIHAVISSNKGSGDTVIMGGDFNAHNTFTTVTTLRDTYGYNLRASDWVDQIFTAGSALSATPQINIVSGTGSDHDGVKVTWSGGLSGGSGVVTSPPVQSCGYIPSTCSGDLNWAMSSGRYENPEFYPHFQDWTGVSLSNADHDDMTAYWVCSGQNPNGNCDGLEMPCNWDYRSCSNAAFEIEDVYGGHSAEAQGISDKLLWSLVAVGTVIAVAVCVVMVVCVWRHEKEGKGVLEEDGVELKEHDQIRGVDDQRIDLEDSDGDLATMEATA